MNRNSSSQSISIIKRLSNFAIRQNVPFDYILTSFLLEKLVLRLVHEEHLSSHFVFKGGYVGLRVYSSPRYTVDLDVLLIRNKLSDILELVKHCVQLDMGDEVWFSFERTVDLLTQGEYPGLRIVFRAGIGGKLADLKRAKIIHLDIGVGDRVMPIRSEIPYILGGGILSWNVYSPETIVAEKLHAMIERGSTNSRAKDLVDLNYLIPLCDPLKLSLAVKSTFKARSTSIDPKIWQAIGKIDFSIMKRGWSGANEFSNVKEEFGVALNSLIDALKDLDL